MPIIMKSAAARGARAKARQQYGATMTAAHAEFRRAHAALLKERGSPSSDDPIDTLEFHQALSKAKEKFLRTLTAAQAARSTLTSEARNTRRVIIGGTVRIR